jgi:NAD+ synthase
MNIEKVINQITGGIKDFTDIAVIGMSGGADSTAAAILSARALGTENVYGFGMPYNTFDKETFNSRSAKIADKLGINYEEIPIKVPVESAMASITYHLGREKLSPLNLGNIKSRMRMIYLYTFATHIAEQTGKRVRVIGKGNLSEDFIGYDTKGGDALADIFPIGNLYKSEVYALLDYFVEHRIIDEEHIDRIPSAGLENGQTDEQDLGYSYNEMQPAIEFCLKHYDDIETMSCMNNITEFVRVRHLANRHKHLAISAIKLDKE